MGLIAERALVRTGAVIAETTGMNRPVKEDPLPAGVYWADIIDHKSGDANIVTFRDWLTLHVDTVELLREEEHNATADWNVFETEPHRLWVLFRVKSPTSWDGQELGTGWPNTAHENMVEGDTIDAPDPPPTIFDEGFEFPTWMKWTVIGVGVVGAGVLALALIRR